MQIYNIKEWFKSFKIRRCENTINKSPLIAIKTQWQGAPFIKISTYKDLFREKLSTILRTIPIII